ncbi:uncharacterized protein MELLADRAFT_123820 [Melampsora larici-populina 98AG31]|uniref:Secreted protein n=1 Tax=Melampsora larici-populina (strain 98AG31 / pathotype 3-4-7) TaxID=747676 RepID=F4RAP7_MELLP|nr:uncharacterized protein MELLADRAFT_123820 [Melampsora larici-populina 98AG31]EGG10517.1 secreted protein [Melampsora larici-populina 98AG31]
MLHQSFVKICVLASILCLSSLIVSSTKFFTTKCHSEFTGSDSDDIIVCKDGRNSEQQNCHKKQCWLNGNQWVQLDGCVIAGSHGGVSKQQCVRYNWMEDDGVFECHNDGGRDYYCGGTPETIPFITCTSCFST